jgi:hypothetical protein
MSIAKTNISNQSQSSKKSVVATEDFDDQDLELDALLETSLLQLHIQNRIADAGLLGVLDGEDDKVDSCNLKATTEEEGRKATIKNKNDSIIGASTNNVNIKRMPSLLAPKTPFAPVKISPTQIANETDIDLILSKDQVNDDPTLTSSPTNQVLSHNICNIKRKTSSILKQPSYLNLQSLDSSGSTRLGLSTSGRYPQSPSTNTNLDISSSQRLGASGRGLGLSNSGSTTAMRRTDSSVCFQAVHVREYDRSIGDNPSCESGIPISLDWSYSAKSEVSIDEYELSHKTRTWGKYPRKLSKYHRENIVKLGLGVSEQEIQSVKSEKKKIQRSRSMTALVSPFWRVQDAMESTQRKIGRALGKNKNEIEADELDRSFKGGILRKKAVGSDNSAGLDLSSSTISRQISNDDQDGGLMF